ncbi:MAG TPA: HAD family hydrolase [Phycisphaerae bacterium]|nr:HAD family hydrolase [Phycisphaerae bacterium]
MTHPSPVGLFLDFYGTITSGDRDTVEAICQRVIEEHDLPLAAGAMGVQWGRRFFALIERSNGKQFRTLLDCQRISLAQTLSHLGLEVPCDGYVEPFRRYMRQPRLQPEVVDALRAIELPICLVSNADHDDLLAAIEHSGLRFDEVVTSQQVRCYKPDPGIFRQALTRTGWSADRVLHAGDSLHSDVAGARAAGVRTVWVRRQRRISDLPRAEPDYTVADLCDLAVLLRRLRIDRSQAG